jgi:hypothetical protein
MNILTKVTCLTHFGNLMGHISALEKFRGLF